MLKWGKNLGNKDQKICYFYVCWVKCLYEADIGGQKIEFAYAGTVLKFLRCVFTQDVAGDIRDTSFTSFHGRFL